MKSTELKKLISERFNIAKKDIRVKQDHGWIHIYIREELKGEYDFKDFRAEKDFLIEIEKLVVENTTVYTYTTDDGYGTDRNCILTDFDSFEFL